MEEIVRAFNFVIEKGWVRFIIHYKNPLLIVYRLSIGPHPNGLREK